MFSLVSRLFAPLLLLFLSLPAVSLAELEPSEEQSRTVVELVAHMEHRHYAKIELNDDFSKQLFERYLDTLDRNRMFLLQSDIKELSNFKLSLDDELKSGDLENAFRLFGRYHARIINRLEWVNEKLPELIAAMDFSIDESLLIDRSEQPWPADAAEADQIWKKHLKNQALGLKLADKAPEEIIKLLQKRYRNQLIRVRQYNAEDVFSLFMNAYTGLYDPHSNYFSPRTSENFNINMSLRLEGIGAVLQAEDEYTKVVRLVAAGPADKQGELQPSDRIVGVAQGTDGEMEDVIGWRLDDVVDLIRGPKGSVVRLEVLPVDGADPDLRKEIQITRNEVLLEDQSAQKEVIHITQGDREIPLGVISVPAFYIDFEGFRRGDENFKSTTRDVKRLLDELVNEDKVEGIIIDLRDNGGGSLSEATALTGLFIESGPTVQIRLSGERVYRDGKADRGPYYDGPLLVLVNRLSASASEIFAGAIQDYQRGLVVGGQSFGKGTVQTLTPLQHGQLKLTNQKFYRISGESTQHRGVIPDIKFPALFDRDKVGESSLDNALAWDEIAPTRHKYYFDFNGLMELLTKKHEERMAQDPDFILLKEQMAEVEKDSHQTEVSLNEDLRRQQREERRARSLAIENRRRAAKGIELLKSWDDEESEQELEDSEASDQSSDEDKPIADAYLKEAGHILVDALPAYRDAKMAYRGGCSFPNC